MCHHNRQGPYIVKPLCAIVILSILATNTAYSATMSAEMEFIVSPVSEGWSGTFTYDVHSAEPIDVFFGTVTRFELVAFEISALGNVWSEADSDWSAYVAGDEFGNLGLSGEFFDDESGLRLTSSIGVRVGDGAGSLAAGLRGHDDQFFPLYNSYRSQRFGGGGSQVPEPTATLLFAIGFAIIGRTMKVRRNQA